MERRRAAATTHNGKACQQISLTDSEQTTSSAGFRPSPSITVRTGTRSYLNGPQARSSKDSAAPGARRVPDSQLCSRRAAHWARWSGLWELRFLDQLSHCPAAGLTDRTPLKL